MNRTDEPPTIHQLIPRIMAAVGAVTKDRTNQQQGFRFRGIDDVMNALHRPLADNGVFYLPEVLEREEEVRQTQKGGSLFVVKLKVRYWFYGPAGDAVECVVWGEAMDSADKATNKALSAALKYALLQVFCVPTEDMEDADGQHHEDVRAAPQGPPQRKQGPATNGPDHVPPDVSKARLEAQAALSKLELMPDEIRLGLQAVYGVDDVSKLDAGKAKQLAGALSVEAKQQSFMAKAMAAKAATESWEKPADDLS